MYNDDFLSRKLAERVSSDSLRQLTLSKARIDFCSNDYLGIRKNNLVKDFFTGEEKHGSGGARTLSGNYPLIEEMEHSISVYHNAEAGLIFNSGYNANIGIMSCVPQRGDTILYDHLIHASLRDGIRLSNAESFKFRHNDANDLEKKLKHTKGTVFVVTESVFSMDGDFALLNELVTLCERYDAHLIIDEAHATGVIGNKGEGLVQHLNLESKIFARIHAFGKAIGAHGAIILGSQRLKSYLINFARSFLFTTVLPEASLTPVKAAYRLLPILTNERSILKQLGKQFNESRIPLEKLPGCTPIKAVIIPGNDVVKNVAAILQQHDLDIRPILYPTVPKDSERLRINLHSFNTADEVQLLIDVLKTIS